MATKKYKYVGEVKPKEKASRHFYVKADKNIDKNFQSYLDLSALH